MARNDTRTSDTVTRPGDHSAKTARRAGAPNHQEDSKETPMVRLTLDDTLHAIVQLTREHSLPLAGVNVHAGDVQVFTADADLACWVRWLTDTAHAHNPRVVCWRNGGEVAVHVRADREGIRWTVTMSIPDPIADAVLADYRVTITTDHDSVPAALVLDLVDQQAREQQAAREEVA